MPAASSSPSTSQRLGNQTPYTRELYGMPHALTMTRDLLTSKPVRWAILLTAALLVAAYVFTDARKFLTIEAVRDAQSWFMEHYDRAPLFVTCCFFVVFTGIAALSLPGAAALMLVAGSSFGLVGGTVLSTFASALGATLAMLATRFLLRDWIALRFGTRLAEVNRGIEARGLYYLFSLRVVPVVPYFALNWLSGLTNLRVWPFFWVSFIGMLPGTAVYVNAGNELAKVNSFADVFSAPIVASLLLIAAVPLLLKYLIEKYNAARARA